MTKSHPVRETNAADSVDVVTWILCAAGAAFGAWALQVGWHHDILDVHGWRQTHTAISAYELVHGGPFWRYRTPIFGPPWQWPLELPVYQWLVAVVSRALPLGLETAGRAVSVAFFVGVLLAVWMTLDIFGMSARHRPVVLALLWTSPLYIFWSRTFMIESTALCLAAAYVAAVHRATRDDDASAAAPRGGIIVIAAILGALAGATKVTTLTPFLVAAMLLVAVRSYGARWSRRALVWTIVGALVVPAGATAAWLAFAGHVKAAGALTRELGWSEESVQRFGSLADRFNLRAWIGAPANAILGRTRHTVVGSVWVFGGALVAALTRPRRFVLCLACLALYALPIALFQPLFRVHVYYQYANGLFLTLVVGCGVVTCLEARRQWTRWAGVALLAWALTATATNYLAGYYVDQEAGSLAPMTLAILTERLTRPDDVMLIYGQDYSPALPYEARRRAIMDWKNRSIDDPPIRDAVGRLAAEGGRIGAVVVCGPARGVEAVRANIPRLGFPVVPVHSEPYCDLYVR
jgi:hypothetical protein